MEQSRLSAARSPDHTGPFAGVQVERPEREGLRLGLTTEGDLEIVRADHRVVLARSDPRINGGHD